MLFYQLGPAAGMGKLGAAARWAGTRSAAGFPSLCCLLQGVEVPDPTPPVGRGVPVGQQHVGRVVLLASTGDA